MEIVWDEPKRLSNLATHGFDFRHAHRCDWESAILIPSYRGRRGERRLLAVMPGFGTLVSIAFAPLGSQAISIISMRHASRRERRLYAQA